MAEIYKESRVVERGTTRERGATTDETSAWTAARTVYLILGVVEALLGMRFLLSILGANRGNAFADFIYSVSHPFVAPFFGLFNYREQFGVARFEVETLVAMAVYIFVAWLMVQLISIATHTEQE